MSNEILSIPLAEAINRNEAQIKFAPPITLNELLGHEIDEGTDLTFGQRLTHFFKVDRKSSPLTQLGGVINYRLTGYPYWRFLKTIAPVPNATSVSGTIQDWEMPDNTTDKTRLEHHRSYIGEEVWDTFEDSRRIYMDTLNSDPRLVGHKTAWNFTQFIGMDFGKTPDFVASILNDQTPQSIQAAFIQFLQGRHNLKNRKWVSGGDINQIRKKIPNLSIYSSEYALLTSTFLVQILGNGDSAMQRYFIDQYNQTFNPKLPIFEYDQGKTLIKTPGLVKAEIDFKPNPNGKHVWDASHDNIELTSYMLSTFNWEKDQEGNKQWRLGFLEGPLVDHFHQIMDISDDGRGFTPKMLNTTVGLATVPYAIPSLRTDWPKYQAFRDGKTVPVKKGERGNVMGPAQVLTLALQRKDESINSELHEAAEEYIEKYAT